MGSGPNTPLYMPAVDALADGYVKNVGNQWVFVPTKIDVVEVPKLIPPTIGYGAVDDKTPLRGYFSTFDFSGTVEGQGMPHFGAGSEAAGNPYKGLYGFLDHTSYFTWIFLISAYKGKASTASSGPWAQWGGYGGASKGTGMMEGSYDDGGWWTTSDKYNEKFWGSSGADYEYQDSGEWFIPPGYHPVKSSTMTFFYGWSASDIWYSNDGFDAGPGWSTFPDWLSTNYLKEEAGYTTYTRHQCWWKWYEESEGSYEDLSLSEKDGNLYKYSHNIYPTNAPADFEDLHDAVEGDNIRVTMNRLTQPTSYDNLDAYSEPHNADVVHTNFIQDNAGPWPAGNRAYRIQYKRPSDETLGEQGLNGNYGCLRPRYKIMSEVMGVVNAHLTTQYQSIADSLYYSVIPRQFTAKVQKAKPIPPQGISSMIHYSSLSRTYSDDLLKGVYSQDLAALLELDAEYLAAGAMDRDYDALDQPAMDAETLASYADGPETDLGVTAGGALPELVVYGD